jgi:hypothetical protein
VRDSHKNETEGKPQGPRDFPKRRRKIDNMLNMHIYAYMQNYIPVHIQKLKTMEFKV